MRCREKNKKPGDVFPVRDSYHYPLPKGLAAGTLVKLIHHAAGYWIVEANGEQFTVFKTLVDSGFEYDLKGQWYPEEDPRIQAVRAATTLANQPAFSCVSGGCLNPPI